MNAWTFKQKIARIRDYKFTDSELQRLIEVVRELGAEIEIIGGISFNKALAKIARKKV